MRFRVVAFVFLLILIAIGCRQPLTPNVDRNQAPETWITAAPQDTITERDRDGVPRQTVPGTIAVRFHPYWAGADHDGEVVGFYWAVVETLPLPPPGLRDTPPLPGPKPGDYHYTSKTDSTFIFRVSESAPDRQHAFFIYAVDNQGKGDATPARVIFNAQDNFPPNPVLDFAAGTGPIFRVNRKGVVSRKDTVVHLVEMLTNDNFATEPAHKVPVSARLDFRWHGEPVITGTYVTGYLYKLDESQFVRVDSSVRAVSYNTGVNGDVIQPGKKLFTLKAVDQANGAAETNRRFRLNYPPDTWVAGPDPALYPKKDWRGLPDPNGQRWIEVPDWANPPNFPASLFSCDSLTDWPGQHPEKRTFFEIYDPDGPRGPLRDRVYVRSEYDTVHMNSWIVLHTGSSDLDSPYSVRVNPIDPDLPEKSDYLICGIDTAGIASGDPELPKSLRPGPANGSAIAFRSKVVTFLDPRGPLENNAFSNPYPVFDPVSNFRSPFTASYNAMSRSGQAYAWARAVDGNNLEDETIGNGAFIVRAVDGGGGTEAERAVRHKIVTFYVNKAPELLFSQGGFFPNPGVNDSATSRTFNLRLFADDLDPYSYPPPAPGGPSDNEVLRWNIYFKGRRANGDTATYVPPGNYFFAPQIDAITLPPYMAGTRDTLMVQLCDCASCETTAGQGRCINYAIPFKVPPPPPSPGLAIPADYRGRPGPGPSGPGNRSGER
jgi:hypothetical protein